MLPYKTLIHIDRSAKTPLYLQITNEFIRHITAGVLESALKLPGTRKLATLLNIHRRTAVSAYEELEAQGWIEVRPSQGCFVSTQLPTISGKKGLYPSDQSHQSAHTIAQFNVAQRFKYLVAQPPRPNPPAIASIDDGYPDVRLAPLKALGKNLNFILSGKMGPALMTYNQAFRGDLLLREEILGYLKETRGIKATLNNILLTRGSLMGFYILFQTLLKSGQHVIVGNPGFDEGYNTIRLAGGKLISVPVDKDGLDVDAVERECQERKIRAVYIIPHHHYPTTVSLSAPRRMQLLSLAAQHKFAIIEDDYDYDFHYASSPILPIASSDYAGSVVYVGSLSKILAPSLRIGFIVAPQNLIEEITRLSQYVDSFGNTALERAVAMLFADGDVGRHIRKAVRTYRARRDLFCRLLHEKLSHAVRFNYPEGGMAVWVRFKEKYRVEDVSQKAMQLGLRLPGTKQLGPDGKSINALRMGFASLNEDEMHKALELLRKSVG